VFTRYDDNLAGHIYLRTLQDISEALFYKFGHRLPRGDAPDRVRPQRDRGSEPKPDRDTTACSK
jgi:hypothetical protein